MGIVFQMPAITYVLARIGLVTAKFLIRIWKTALIVILIAAAVLSPTNDIPNMLLFAAPMIALYIVSIFVAWIFSRPRTAGLSGAQKGNLRPHLRHLDCVLLGNLESFRFRSALDSCQSLDSVHISLYQLLAGV